MTPMTAADTRHPTRRLVLWASSTAVIVTLLFGYHTSLAGAMGSGAPLASTEAPVTAGQTATRTSATTVTGDAAMTRYGPVQVQVTTQGGTITAVSVPVYPANGRDAQINGYALPILVQQTLDKQSAAVDMVSGATFTSEGYRTSLQSALDQAGL